MMWIEWLVLKFHITIMVPQQFDLLLVIKGFSCVAFEWNLTLNYHSDFPVCMISEIYCHKIAAIFIPIFESATAYSPCIMSIVHTEQIWNVRSCCRYVTLFLAYDQCHERKRETLWEGGWNGRNVVVTELASSGIWLLWTGGGVGMTMPPSEWVCLIP